MSAEYVGDGLYAEWDGIHLILKANDNLHPTDTVYLDYAVITELIRYLIRCGFDIDLEAQP